MLARAKVNLALHVTARRADGWHELDSLVVFAEIGDKVSLAPAAGLTVTGPFAKCVPRGPENLALRAAALAGKADAGLILEKNLPVAAGLGGGSSDAAAVLRLFSQEPPLEALMTLGADVPVCLSQPVPQRMRGLGEKLDPVVGLPRLWLVLVNPGRALPTAAVFRALETPNNSPLPSVLPRFAEPVDFARWLALQRNDLEAPARRLEPVIDRVLAALAAQSGCLVARMSGSGASCFGIFTSQKTRDEAASALSRLGWWVAATATAHRTP